MEIPSAISRPASRTDFTRLAEPHRRELQVHCYRMVGSLQDAEDLVQETLVRAWKKLDTFEGRASFRAWLYKIATNLCLDALDRRPRRTLPQAASQAADPQSSPALPATEPIWLEPLPENLTAGLEFSPEARYAARESISLAFLVALQALPPRQRAVLILCDVLDWRAEEAAALFEISPAAVSSALYRARVTLARHYTPEGPEHVSAEAQDANTRTLLQRYVQAWEAADGAELLALLKEEAVLAMPPTPSWYRGGATIRAVLEAMPFAGEARGHWHLVPTRANGVPAFATYARDESAGQWRAQSIQVVEVEGGRIATITAFLDPALFAHFHLPATMPVEAERK